jgi:hypothetical protein
MFSLGGLCCDSMADSPGSVDDGAWLDEPSRDLSFGARIKGLPKLLHHRPLASPLVALDDATLIAVGEELLGPRHLVVALLQQVDDGDGIVQIPGRKDLHAEPRQRMRLATWW